MSRKAPTRLFTKSFLILLTIVIAALLTIDLASGGAQSILTDAVVVPGDVTPTAAAGYKESLRIARGTNTYLAVWTDSRTLLANEGAFGNIGFNGPYTGTGLGSMKDIYAARVAADGHLIDTVPIIVSQAGYNQGYPQVGWSGQNWLVTWISERESDRYTYEVRAARVSLAGQLLDTTSIVLKSPASFEEAPSNIITDGNGNWITVSVGFSDLNSGVRSVFAIRVSPLGIVLERREIYQHSSQYLGEPDLARAGDRYLLTYSAFGPIMGVLLDANLNPLRNGPELLSNGGNRPRVVSDGNSWLVVTAGTGINAIFVSRDGDPTSMVSVTSNVGTDQAQPQASWDGSNWFVAYNTDYNAAAGTFVDSDVYLTRLSPAGVVLDSDGLPVRIAAGSQVSVSITNGVEGGAQIAWTEQDREDVRSASVSAAGLVSSDQSLAFGAPRQSKVRSATNGNGFLSVFRSDTLAGSRILGQHFDVNGAAIDQAPFLIANSGKNNNPSVGWNGSDYLVVWELATPATGQAARQTFGRVVPATGGPLSPEFFIMNGELPDASGLNGNFLVTNIIQETSEIRRTQFVRTTGTGTPIGAPVKFTTGGGTFNYSPRSAAFGNRWLAVWEGRLNHDGSAANTYGSFIEEGGSFSAPVVMGNGGVPSLAVAGNTGQALIVSGSTIVRSRRLNADGSSPDPLSGRAVSASTSFNGKSSVTWDGNQYVVTWIDQRGESSPLQPKGDIFAARVSVTNVAVEEFPVANSVLPEETPFVIAANGLTFFSYAKFYGNIPAEGPSLASHHITMRTSRFPAPDLGTLPNAPTNLVTTEVPQGSVTLAWNDNSTDEVGFKIESRLGTGPWSQVREVGANVTSANGFNVGGTTSYYFRVRAFNVSGDSVYSNEASPPIASMNPFSPNTYTEPASVQINATATDPEGIQRVEFYYATDATYPNYTLLSTDTIAPYSYAWSNVSHGYYYVKARVYDNQGSWNETDYESFVVYQLPLAQITSPANGASFTGGSSFTINANAQAGSGASYLLRMDFYANSTLIGTVTGHYESYSFTWANAPTGAYALTARPTSNLGLTGTSTPVNITVGNAGFNISGRITDGTSSVYNATITLSGSQTGTAKSDPNGDFTFTNVTAGAGITITPSATGYTFSPGSLTFSGLAANQIANFTANPGSPINPDPNAIPIYSQPQSSNVETSSKVVVGYLIDTEVADDFNVTGSISRVVVHGGRSFNTPANPIVRGAYLRFFNGSAALPGALLTEYYFAAGSPNLKYNHANPADLDFTLPTPFNAVGKYFMSAQLVIDDGTWFVNSSEAGPTRGSGWVVRYNLYEPVWTTPNFPHDMSFDLYGTATGAPQLIGVAPQTVERSGWIKITGSNLGSAQGASLLKVDGLNAIVIKWTDTEIIGYVPEAASAAPVSVVVSSAAGTSNSLLLTVKNRQDDGRLRWRVKVLGNYMDHSAAIAPAGSPDAGSVYANIGGLVYSWSASGALKWIVKVGDAGIMSVGPDGTIYVADSIITAGSYRAALTALNKDGSVKWQKVDSTTRSLLAGPNVGPDGKIYVVFGTGQYNTAGFNPDGSLAWSSNDQLAQLQTDAVREIVFGHTLSRLYFSLNTVNGHRLIAHDLNGNTIFTSTNGSFGAEPAVPPDDNLRHYNQSLSAANGAVLYTFNNTTTNARPDAGADNTHYLVQNTCRLFAVNANGTEKWRFDDMYNGNCGILDDPVISPTNNIVLVGGRITYGQPGFFTAVNAADGQLAWKMILPNEPDLPDVYGNLVPFNRPAFASDGSTAYSSVWIAASPGYSYFYAVNTTSNNVLTNEPPVLTITNPVNNSNLQRNSVVEVRAHVQDTGPVDRVEFRMRGSDQVSTLLGIDTTPDANGDYTVSYTASRAGGYAIDVLAIDTGGLSDAEYVYVMVANAYPQVSWVSPVNDAVIDPPPTSLTLTVHASDADGNITNVEFWSNGQIGSDNTPDANGNFSIQWANPPTGLQTVYAWADDNDLGRSNGIVTFRIGPTATPTPSPSPSPSPSPVGQPPVVSITSPVDGTIVSPGTNVTVTAAASDPDGTIARVDFYQGFYNQFISTDFNPPFTATINSGSPTLFDVYAVATDNSANTKQSASIRMLFQYPATDPNGQLKISGRVRHQQSAPGNEIFLPNALINLNLNNQFVRATHTDAGGNYLFDHLSRGGRYEIIPSEPGYVFAPPSVFFEGLLEDRTWDFTGAGPLPNPTPTPTPTPGANALTWEKFYDGPTHLADFNPIIAVDGQGNTYLTATSGSATDEDTDISTIKYSAAGLQMWARTFAGPGGYKDWANDIKVDAQGNAYVTGVSWSGAFAGSEYDAVTIKYDAAGTQLWVRYYNGASGHWDRGEALALDSSGNVYIAGYSQSTRTSGATYDELLAIKYDTNGNQQWARLRSTAQIGDYGYRIAVDAAGNSYITGTAFAINAGIQTRDLVTVKYSTAGQELWAARYTGVAGDPGIIPLPNNPVSSDSGGIDLDPSGNVYVFGTNNPNSEESDYLLLKYNPADGALIWSRTWSGLSADYARDMAIDVSGNIFLTGESWDGDYNSATSSQTWNAVTVKFDGAGTVIWASTYRGFPGKTDAGRAVVLDAAGNVYVGAYSAGFLNADTAVIKYQPDGTEAWVYRYDNPQHTGDSLREMKADSAGNLYLGGQAVLTNTTSNQTLDLVTVKLATTVANVNSPPSVTVAVNGATASRANSNTRSMSTPIVMGRNLTLTADATDRDGTVARVDFYDGPNLLGTDTTAPFSFQWDNAPLGMHAIIAAATDSVGATRSSPTISVTVVDAAPVHLLISGRVMANGLTLSGATITLSGAQADNTQTDANGNYSFTNLPAGGIYTVTPSRANFVFTPASLSFSLTADKSDAMFTGIAINPDLNPLETPEFFVRQQYLDFLGREPDQGGLDYWSSQLRACGQDLVCINTRRLDISAAFFIAQEFQDSGLYIYDVYQGALGRRPNHAEYAADRRNVVGGSHLEADKAAFALSFVARAEFTTRYPSTMTADTFVDALLQTAQQSSGIDLSSSRAALITLYNSGANATESRSLVLRSVAETSLFKQTQYNAAFVLMEYYSYLGRNPDNAGYTFWLNVLNSGGGNNYRGMVCSFITSTEYQRRFSAIVTRSNAECAGQ